MPERKAPRQARSRQLVGAVVEAAIEILSRPPSEGRGGDPSEGFSMRKLAERAGVGIGSVYDYFSDRDALLDAVVDRITEENFRRLEASFPEGVPLEDALVLLFDATFDLYWGNETLTRVATETITRLGRGRHIVAVRDRFLDLVVARIVRESPPLDAELVRVRVETIADMVFGLLLSDLYRPLDAAAKGARRAIARTVARRAVIGELQALRNPSTLPSPAEIARQSK